MSNPYLIYNDDGWSSYMRYPAPMSPEDVAAVTVGAVRNTGVKVYQFCALGGHAVNYNSSFLPRVGAKMSEVDTLHVWRMRETLQNLERLGTDPLRIVRMGLSRGTPSTSLPIRVSWQGGISSMCWPCGQGMRRFITFPGRVRYAWNQGSNRPPGK